MKKPYRFIRFCIYTFIVFLIVLLSAYFILDYRQEPCHLDDVSRKSLGGTFVKLSKGVVNYELKGADTGKLVIFVHGAGSGYFAWDRNYNWLAKNGYQVLRYDLYGRGFSDRPNVDYNIELFRGQLDELLRALKLSDKRFTMVGVSMGCSIAIDFAQKHIDLVDDLILVDPASLPVGSPPVFVTAPILSDLLFTFYWRPKAVQKQMSEFYDESLFPEFRIKLERQMKFEGYKRAIKSTWKYSLCQNMRNELLEINKSKCKVHFIWGNNDRLTPVESSKEYLKLVSSATLDIVDKAGHLANYEKGDEVNALLDKYLTYER